MGDQIKVRQANRGTLPYQVGQYLHKHGPMTEHDLFSGMGIRISVTLQDDTVQRSLRSGWLVTVPGDKIDCSPTARDHFDREAGIVRVKPMGEIAAPREINVFKQPPLSQKYMINSRGSRRDVPAWSIRGAQTFHRA